MFKRVLLLCLLVSAVAVCCFTVADAKRIEDSVSDAAPNGNQDLLRFAEKAEAQEQEEGESEDESSAGDDEDEEQTESVSKEEAKDAIKEEKVNEKLSAAKEEMKSTDDAVNAAAEEASNEAGKKAKEAAIAEKKNEEEVEEAVEKAKADKEKEIEENDKKENIKKEVMKETVKEAKKEAAKEAADAVELSPEEILENEKTRRQEQFLTSLTPEAIASAEVELSSVFSGVLGSLLTNMLSKQPELVEALGQRKEARPNKGPNGTRGIAVPKTNL